MSTLRINRIVIDSYVDGPGRRVAVFFQGCTIGCQGCQNRALWPHADGNVFSPADLAGQLLSECDQAGHRNVTISGGEPFEQPLALAELARLLKEAGAHLIVYTGNIYEDLAQTPETADALAYIDILVDGPYIIQQDNPNMQYRGSQNQRPIDMNATRQTESVVLLDWDTPELIITHDGRILSTGPMAAMVASWGLGAATPSRRCGQTSQQVAK